MAFNIKDQFSLGTSNGAHDPISGSIYATGGIFDIVSVVIRNIYVIASIILFIFIIAGGMGMILNAGNVDKQKQSSQTLTSAVIGFLILFASYWLIRIIQVITGINLINL